MTARRRQSWTPGPRARRAVVPGVVGVTACAPAVASDLRPVQTLGVVAAVVVLAAVVTGARLLGSAALLLVSGAVVIATAGTWADGDHQVGLGRLAASATLLTVLASTLDRAERERWAGDATVDEVATAPLAARALPGLVAVGAAAGVAVAATTPVQPSVALVVVGLGAAVALLAVATRSR